MAGPNFPPALSLAAWERQSKSLKKTASLAGVATALKALAKDHDAAGFDAVDAAKSAAPAAAEGLLGKAAAAAKAIGALAVDAKALDALARRLETELKKDKQPGDAALALAKAAAAYAAEMQRAAAGAEQAHAELAKKAAEAKAAAKSAEKTADKAAAPADPALVKLAERIKGRTLGAFKSVCRPGAQPMPFMMAVGPKKCLLSMGPSVSPSEKNQLMKLVTEDGTRYHPGTCSFDKAANLFVFTGATLPAGAGLGARLQKSLVAQLGKKVRVRVMRPDGTSEDGDPVDSVDGFDDVDESAAHGDDGVAAQLDEVLERLAALPVAGSPAADEVARRTAAARAALAAGNDAEALKAISFLEVVAERLAQPHAAAEPAAAAAAAPVPKAPPAPPLPAATVAQGATRLKALQDLFRNAPVMKTDAGRQIQDRLDRALKALQASDAAAAKKELDALDAVARALAAKAPAPATGGKVLFTQSRLRWDGARKKVQSELRKLEAAIVAAAQGEPDLDEIVASARGLYRVLDQLDETLIDRLDEAATATDAASEAKAREAARQVIARYRGFVDSDPLMLAIDDNPFGKVDVRASVLDALTDLQSRLAA